jgi:hypothetical protein
VGVQELQAIENAWNNAIASVQRRQQLQQQAAYQQSEIEARTRTADLQQKEFDAQQKQQEVQNQAAQAQLALQRTAAFQKVGENYESTGILPPNWGLTKGGTPSALPVKGTPGPVNGTIGPSAIPISQAVTAQSASPYDQVTLVAPPEMGGGSFTAYTPESYARKQADLARIQNAPAEEMAEQKIKAEKDAQLALQLKVLDTKFGQDTKMEAIKNGYEKGLLQQRLDHETYINGVNNSLKLQLANMNLQGGLTSDGGSAGALTYDQDGNPTFTPTNNDIRLKNIVEGAANGTLTQDAFKKQFPNTKFQQAIGNILGQNGLDWVNDKQQKAAQDIGVAASIVPKLKDAYDQMNNHQYSIQWDGSDAYRKFKADRELIQGVVPQIARVMDGTNRYSPGMANDMAKKLIPDLSIWTSLKQSDKEAQNEKYGQLIKDIQDYTVRTMGNLSPQQQRAVRNRLQVPNLPDALLSPGTQEPTQPGFQSGVVGGKAQTPSLDKLGDEDRITVYDNKNQNVFTQKKKYVLANPQRYRVLGIPGQGGGNQ